MRTRLFAAGLALALLTGAPGADRVGAAALQPGIDVDPLHRGLDQILDLYVRDGFVYYAALRSERGRLDRYVASLDVSPSTYEGWSRDQRIAFWVNAYNAFVLRSVIDHYPIRGQSAQYPSSSIRQIPGVFDGRRHRAAGRSVTLDEIETVVLAGFDDPRLYLALGRGAVGSGRLLSEAYTSQRLEDQLNRVTAEFAGRNVRVDRSTGRMTVNPILGWREADFAAAYAGRVDEAFETRSPIERAAVALVLPHLYPGERDFLRRNTFVVEFGSFDWRLNDLTGGRP